MVIELHCQSEPNYYISTCVYIGTQIAIHQFIIIYMYRTILLV